MSAKRRHRTTACTSSSICCSFVAPMTGVVTVGLWSSQAIPVADPKISGPELRSRNKEGPTAPG